MWCFVAALMSLQFDCFPRNANYEVHAPLDGWMSLIVRCGSVNERQIMLHTMKSNNSNNMQY